MSIIEKEKEEEEILNESESENEEGSDIQEEDEERIPIDLSENEIYRGVCTLLEDDEGNNILEYISLLHTELININKNMEYVKSIKDDIHRIANSVESYVKHQGIDLKKDKKSSKKE